MQQRLVLLQLAAPGQPRQQPTALSPGEERTITITTDVVKADIDTIGGEIKRLELLKYADSHDAKKNVVLFDYSADRTYAAQTGLIARTCLTTSLVSWFCSAHVS